MGQLLMMTKREGIPRFELGIYAYGARISIGVYR